MIELVSWTCIVGFSPAVLGIGLRFIAIVAAFVHRPFVQPSRDCLSRSGAERTAPSFNTPLSSGWEKSAMCVEIVQSPEFFDLVSRFPLRPLEDDDSYQAAIEILDRLYELDRRQTQDELDYFRALANLAFNYERANGVCDHSNCSKYYLY
jgi:hypothetical protein